MTQTADNAIKNWQNWMLNALIKPDEIDGKDIDNRFTAGANLSAAQCLGVYQRSYILRLTKCLAEQFPALCHALGEPLFEQFARKYLREYPSDSYTLYELGRRFGAFLQQDRPDKDLPPQHRESWIDFMVDLAHYEQLHFSLFDAPGHEGNSWPQTNTPDDQLILQPCFALAQYQYPVAWYYHAIKEEKASPFPPKQPSYVALLRKDYQVTTFPVSQVHFLFLQKIQNTKNINTALNFISEVTKVPIEAVTQSWHSEIKAKWIDAGFFVNR